MAQVLLHISKYYDLILNEIVLSRIIQIDFDMNITTQATASLKHKKKKYVIKLEMSNL